MSWNTQLLRPLIGDLAAPWKEYDKRIVEAVRDFIDALTLSLDGVQHALKGKVPFQSLSEVLNMKRANKSDSYSYTWRFGNADGDFYRISLVKESTVD